MNLRQAAQQALEALEQFREISDFTPASAVHAITALRAALAEPEQKPSGSFVLWQNTLCNPLADPIAMTHSAWHDGYASAKDELERKSDAIQRLWKERDELRALNAELLEALKHAAECVQSNYLPDKMGHDWDDVIAKAEASK